MAIPAPSLAAAERRRFPAGERSVEPEAMASDPASSPPEPNSPSGQPRSSEVMARLTLSALERARREPSLWGQPEVHRALLVSGLSVLVCSLARLREDLG
jgi:hypothetical protein